MNLHKKTASFITYSCDPSSHILNPVEPIPECCLCVHAALHSLGGDTGDDGVHKFTFASKTLKHTFHLI